MSNDRGRDSGEQIHTAAQMLDAVDRYNAWRKEAREELARYAHIAWAGWMIYLFSKSTKLATGEALIPASLVARWERQTTTPYSELPEDEKDSDRAEADKILEIVLHLRASRKEDFPHA